MPEDKLFFVGQKAFISNDQNEVLVLFSQHAEGLDFPGGRLQEGETNLSKSLQREVREETGLTIKVRDAFCTWTNDWESPRIKRNQIFLIGYKCELISGAIKISDEHVRFKWVNKKTYKSLPHKNNYSEALEKYFSLV